MKEIEQVQRKSDQAKHETRNPSDPKLVHASQQLAAMKQDLRDLIARKREELRKKVRDEDKDAVSLRELKGQIDSLKARKSAYEQLLSQLQVSPRQPGTDPERSASVHEDLAAFKEKEAFVEKWIEQLTNDARAGRPR
jgi:hypothetical protein